MVVVVLVVVIFVVLPVLLSTCSTCSSSFRCCCVAVDAGDDDNWRRRQVGINSLRLAAARSASAHVGTMNQYIEAKVTLVCHSYLTGTKNKRSTVMFKNRKQNRPNK